MINVFLWNSLILMNQYFLREKHSVQKFLICFTVGEVIATLQEFKRTWTETTAQVEFSLEILHGKDEMRLGREGTLISG